MRREEQGSTIFLSLRAFFFLPFAVETIVVLSQAYAELVKAEWVAEGAQWPHRRQTRDGVADPARLGGHILWFRACLASAKQATE